MIRHAARLALGAALLPIPMNLAAQIAGDGRVLSYLQSAEASGDVTIFVD